MPCPHNEITIVQRSQRQSAVAAAAYQSGEKLFCEYDQQVKHYPLASDYRCRDFLSMSIGDALTNIIPVFIQE